MALTAYLKLRGETLGLIKGSVIQKGREGLIAVLASNHRLARGADAKDLVHEPFELVKAVDQSSPLLYQALLAGERFAECEIAYWAPGGGSSAAEKQHYRVRLGGARLEAIAFEQPLTLDPQLARWPESETLRLRYESIEWRWTTPPLSAQAQLPAPRKPRAARQAAGSAKR